VKNYILLLTATWKSPRTNATAYILILENFPQIHVCQAIWIQMYCNFLANSVKRYRMDAWTSGFVVYCI